MRIMITGANGFIGQSLCRFFLTVGHEVIAQQRAAPMGTQVSHPMLRTLQTPLQSSPALREALLGCDAIVHTAARAHKLKDDAPSPRDAYREVNTDLTLQLAHTAVECGVKRLVFLSTVKVHGEWTQPAQPFEADGPLCTQDHYAVSKQEAEQGLRLLAAHTGLELVVVRPPLVYGPGVKANFLRMMRWVDKGIVLPLGAIANQRSLVNTTNLASFLELCVRHPAAANQAFLVSDGTDISTTGLLRAIGLALGRPARLLPVPQRLLERGLALLGQGALAQRLCADLCVDIEKNRQLLHWSPPLSLEHGIRRTVHAYRAATNASP